MLRSVRALVRSADPDLKPPVGAPVDVAAILRAVGTK